MLQNIFYALAIILWGGLIFFAIPLGIYMTWLETKRKRDLQRMFEEQIAQGVEMTVKNTQQTAMGLGLPIASTKRVLAKILGHTKDNESNKKISNLVEQLDKVAPFLDIPTETRSSMFRLHDLCEASNIPSDKKILQPIEQALSAFELLKAQVERGRKITFVINIVSIVSFAIGLYGMWISPGAGDIKSAVSTEFDRRMPLQEATTNSPTRSASPSK
ncbi:hypothetical protein AVMA1855_22465 [Acidovorax sp. SUPP1855]|uniref:hypothetical protein n=1 Tax=Acidovorax sp. SUPP1855 TaxID=431774 RepID=UPI0023DE1B10|nr:hypothetical protein [Acidovorax sp. SUPP1855]GKS86967.1 hypothetical protein AVMA1855_22465 [Acidovorax sp. SUPP1855]